MMASLTPLKESVRNRFGPVPGNSLRRSGDEWKGWSPQPEYLSPERLNGGKMCDFIWAVIGYAICLGFPDPKWGITITLITVAIPKVKNEF